MNLSSFTYVLGSLEAVFRQYRDLFPRGEFFTFQPTSDSVFVTCRTKSNPRTGNGYGSCRLGLEELRARDIDDEFGVIDAVVQAMRLAYLRAEPEVRLFRFRRHDPKRNRVPPERRP